MTTSDTHPTGADPNEPADRSSDGRSGPLTDLRVVEMGQLLAGPFCGQLLADFGAEVIKIEPPGVGDPMRQWGREKPHGKSLWFPVVGRNKKSITLNLREEEGQQIARDLIAKSDILVENFRPGTMERWNLGYDALSALNPGLIMVRVSGFGQTGPYASRAGFGAIGEAMGGLRYVMGDQDRTPSRAGISIGDELAATYAALGAMMAIHNRARTGRGQIVDSAIYEAVLAMMESLVTEYDQADFIRPRTGAILPNVAPSNVYPTSDGEVLIAANQDTVFGRLAKAMNRPDLAEDERYKTHSARGSHQTELDDLIADWSRTLTSDDVLALMETNGVPAGLIYRAPEMLADPHFKARQAIIDAPNHDFGTLKMQNVAPRLTETPGAVHSSAPRLGEHNKPVYGDVLGLSDEQLSALADAGVI